ncbi:hypothetical protein BS47DRAFT_1326986 [Hydnum rufescens UP504]|uniref:ubiquitinyl hydrolase 1 n=1 Tax=Hydnum rufescens UP504 TaxID=1448309 RepID=A0A9P6B329_9AGAM|nr:hypothetical protein BS47DRAFT_1326986 [Hydnum rufescens UP504]
MNAPLQQLQLNIEAIFPLLISTIFVGLSLGSRLTRFTDMALQNLGLSFAMSWIYDNLHWHSQDLLVPGEDEFGIVSNKMPRNAKDHLANNHQNSIDLDEYYYPGLVNISGTYCFMNSVLQAFASLVYLLPYLDSIREKAELLDVPTPVVDTLRETLESLNTPSRRRSSLRPVQIIETLSTPASDGSNRSLLFSSREHQDAQELFQLLSSLLKEEAIAVDREGMKELGLGGALLWDTIGSKQTKEVAKGVFDGLTANRRSCVTCGYTEALMHFGFDNLQLSLPFATSVSLEECLAEFTHIEVLTDCVCRKCSLLATHRRLVAEVERFAESETERDISSSKKKRIRETRKYEARLKAALSEDRIEDELKGVRMERVISKMSTKQVMFARTPPILALHLNRSAFYGHATKNPCRVIFQEVLDLTPFTTSGQLSTQPSAPISSSYLQPSSTPSLPKTLYRLSSIVCHYGGHSFGHYVAYRRKPRLPMSGTKRYAPPTSYEHRTSANTGWLRISDDTVQEVGLEAVLAENSGTFMLFYERIATGSLSNDPRTQGVDAPIHQAPSLRESITREATPLGGSEINQESALYGVPRIVRSVSAGVVSRDQSILREESYEPPSSPPSRLPSSTLVPGGKTPVSSTSTSEALNSTGMETPPVASYSRP